jgi:hypothetical protein
MAVALYNAEMVFANNTSFSPCPLNTYKNSASDAACTICPTNSGTGKDTGSRKIGDCLADAGFTGDGSNLAACSPGTYKAEGHSK